MPPTLILVRHAQALHNVDQDSSLPDPELSQLGQEQCVGLRENLTNKLPVELRDNIELIIVSPMRRTIETALRSMDWLLEKGVPIQAHAGWQENTEYPCDTGSPTPILRAEFPQIDYSHLDPIYPDKTSAAGARYRFNKQAILARAQLSLADLYSRPENVVAVVSHSSFLRQGVTGCWFFNADYRIFDFEERKTDDVIYHLKQWSLTKAGGLGLSWEDEVKVGEGLPEAPTASACHPSFTSPIEGHLLVDVPYVDENYSGPDR